MPANECIPFFESADRITAQASAAVVGKKFVTISANKTSVLIPSAAVQIGASDPTEGSNYQVALSGVGGGAIGVSTWDAAIGEKVGVIREGIVPVTVGAGGLTFGQLVQSDATGQAIAATTGKVLGIAMTGASAAADGEILLTLQNIVP